MRDHWDEQIYKNLERANAAINENRLLLQRMDEMIELLQFYKSRAIIMDCESTKNMDPMDMIGGW